jgi:hypothetical protein
MVCTALGCAVDRFAVPVHPPLGWSPGPSDDGAVSPSIHIASRADLLSNRHVRHLS